MTTRVVTDSRDRARHLGPERRRPQVLDAALAIAVDSGTAAVTIGAVADRLGVTRPVVYSCYGDRVALLEALFQREGDGMLDRVLAALHAANGTDPEAAFVTGYTALLHVVAENPGSWQLLFATDPDPSLSEKLAIARKVVSRDAAEWIRPALESWWATADLDRKLPVLVELFVSSSEAAARSLLDPQNDWTADELGEFYGRLICRAFQFA